MADDDDDTPTPPAKPKSFRGGDPDAPGIDRPIRGAFDYATPREMAMQTRGAMSNVEGVNKELQADLVRRTGLDRRLPLGAKNRTKRVSMATPFTLRGGGR